MDWVPTGSDDPGSVQVYLEAFPELDPAVTASHPVMVAPPDSKFTVPAGGNRAFPETDATFMINGFQGRRIRFYE